MMVMASPPRLVIFILALLFFTFSTYAIEVTFDSKSLMLDGERKLIISGSIHYPRSTADMWPDLIKKAKEGGLNTIETYVFWNVHEPQHRQYDFTGNRDIIRFLKTIREENMYAILRIGPYICGEWNFGGFPMWLHNLKGIKMRTDNDIFEIENEYGDVMKAYGDEGKRYLNWCAKLVNDLHIGIPWIMCKQNDSPWPIINTCNGFYCDQANPNNPNYPKIWTENWSGWFKAWGEATPVRSAEDLAFAVARFFQLDGSVMNYYMYHGGTNFGRTAGGPYIATSYDYDAPLDEYGNLNQPKWGHLRQLHKVLMSMEEVLTHGTRKSTDHGDQVLETVITYHGKCVCFLGNANPSKDARVMFRGQEFIVPAWSVTILEDCFTEVFNTAKVNAQRSVMETVKNDAEKEPFGLKWSWRAERLELHDKRGKVQGVILRAKELMDQKFANDTSDYLYYFTSVHVSKHDPIWGKHTFLQVTGYSGVLHLFFNGKYIGSKWSHHGWDAYTLEKKVKLQLGRNTIVLLSGTVGFKNNEPSFDEKVVGVSHGPVKLTRIGRGHENITKDLSKNEWLYKVGLDGEKKKLYNEHSRKWFTRKLPTDRKFVWYKTTFKAPLGTDPVVVDLSGLGKGEAWVNGHSLGRYWQTLISSEDACSESITCDYRGDYWGKKDVCRKKCGGPTQRWYHVPRGFLQNDDQDNELVLFEEFGGNPSYVNFRTMTVKTACAHAYDGGFLELSCQGDQVFTDIKFAYFGETTGSCGYFHRGRCGATNTMRIVRETCLGHKSCSFNISEDTFGPTHCKNNIDLRLAVQAVCS
ncbi:hypothetical protein SLEP1_g49137 [Rubroshorea leprosula]|uniref:beta-galactosidase n=1 Tax=Rubroshorea leprosula TaxID=152421 RepID=A0AAV5LVU1_9ROSI|nr:hypothetical protein SLEP1_g49137 [Rubroshorea leprosula]